MKAGRELDAIIAEKVMGLRVGEYIPVEIQPDHIIYEGWPILDDKGDRVSGLQHYSTRIKDAWEVVEMLSETYDLVQTHTYPGPQPERCHCIILKNFGSVDWTVDHAPNMPLAICRAALKAIEK